MEVFHSAILQTKRRPDYLLTYLLLPSVENHSSKSTSSPSFAEEQDGNTSIKMPPREKVTCFSLSAGFEVSRISGGFTDRGSK